MVLKTDYDRQLWTGLSSDDWSDVPLVEGDVIYIMDLSQCWICGESNMYQLPDLGGGGGGYDNIMDITITSTRSQTTLAQAVAIYGIATNDGYAKGADSVRGGRTINRKAFKADENTASTRTFIFFSAASSTLPMLVSCNVTGSTTTYYSSNMQALLSIPYSAGPITITITDQ